MAREDVATRQHVFPAGRPPPGAPALLVHHVVPGGEICPSPKLGVKVNCFAVPYGFHNDHIRDVVMKAGYEAVFTVYGQPITMHTPLSSVGRYLMEANKPKTFTDAVAAIATTAVGPSVAEVAPSNLQTQPADEVIHDFR